MPADATAVIVNITATNTTASSYLTAYPTPSGSATQPAGATRPLTSVLEWAPGQTIADGVVLPVGSGGTAPTGAYGAVNLYNYTGSADVVVDVVGWAVPAST